MAEAEADVRIALVTHYFDTHGGGVEHVAGRLARELCRKGRARITWFASDCDAMPSNLPPGMTTAPMRSSNTVESHTGLPFPFWSPAALLGLARRLRDSDVVQLHEFAYPSSLATMAFARWNRIPVVLVQHTGDVRPAGRLPRWAYALIEALFAGWMFSAASAIVFVSETSRAYWERRLGRLPEARTIWNGVEAPASGAVDVCEAKPAGTPSDRPAVTVLFVGRLVRKKGLYIVRNLAAALPQFRFVIAGRGLEEPERWNLSNVEAVGHVDAASLATLYKSADVLLLPSYSEGFPLVVQEALLTGLAVLTTDEVAAACPPASALLRHCPVPVTDNVEPWCSALLAAVADKGWLADRALRTRRASELWSWRGSAASHAQVLFEVLARQR